MLMNPDLDTELLLKRSPELYVENEGDIYRCWPSDVSIFNSLTDFPTGLDISHQIAWCGYTVHAWVWIVCMNKQTVFLQAWDCVNGWRRDVIPFPRHLYEYTIQLHEMRVEYNLY